MEHYSIQGFSRQSQEEGFAISERALVAPDLKVKIAPDIKVFADYFMQ